MRDRLAAVDAPTLCIAGDIDTASPPAVVQRVADSIAGASFATIVGSPHMMHLENHEPFAALVSEFVSTAKAGNGRP
jgi:3-oxoadipate enol-lactonase/4-carboxymuconolactone decarboxylase